MAKTMNAEQAAPLGNEAKSSGASFLEVLAGTSALFSLPSLGPLPQTSGSQPDSSASGQSASQADSQDASNAGNAPGLSNDTLQPAQSSLPQTLLAAIAPTTQKAVASQAVTSSAQSHPTTGTDHTAQHKDDTQPPNTSSSADFALPIPVAPPVDMTIAQPVSPASGASTSNTQPVAAVPSSSAHSAADATPSATSVSDLQQFNAALAAKVVNAPTVDAVPSAVGNDVEPVSNSGAQQPKPSTLPASAPPLPASSAAGQPQTQATKHTQADFIAAAVAKTTSTQVAPAVHLTDDQSQTKTQASAAKNTSADAKPATQTSQSTSSQPAGIQTAGNSNTSALSAAVVLPSNLALPGVSVTPVSGDSSLALGKAAQANSKTSDTNSTKLPDATTAADAKKTNDSSETANNNSSNGAANNGPAAQRVQGDASQPSVAARPADAGAAQATAQIQPIAAHAGAHDVAGSPSRADGTAETLRAGDHAAAAETAENTATGSINTANVIQKMSETEMRIGVRSADFGDVSIRTSISQQQMTAQISVDHSDLGKAISAHIPAMEAKLGGDSGLRALVEVNQSGMSFSGDRGFSSQREQKSYAQLAQNQAATVSTETEQPAVRVSAGRGEAYRLDIRA